MKLLDGFKAWLMRDEVYEKKAAALREEVSQKSQEVLLRVFKPLRGETIEDAISRNAKADAAAFRAQHLQSPETARKYLDAQVLLSDRRAVTEEIENEVKVRMAMAEIERQEKARGADQYFLVCAESMAKIVVKRSWVRYRISFLDGQIQMKKQKNDALEPHLRFLADDLAPIEQERQHWQNFLAGTQRDGWMFSHRGIRMELEAL